MPSPLYVRKRCIRCQHVAVVARRSRRCRQPSPNALTRRGSYACWGLLESVQTANQHAFDQLLATGVAGRPTPQQVAAERARLAQKKFDEALAGILRSVTSLKRWQAKARHWSYRASLTDEQLQTERLRRIERTRPGKRGIAKGGL